MILVLLLLSVCIAVHSLSRSVAAALATSTEKYGKRAKAFLTKSLGLTQTQHHPIWLRVYNSIDLDQDGQFSIKEFHAMLPKFDLNGDGLISELEFMDVWDHATAMAHDLARDDAAGRKLFHTEDYNNDGILTMAEAENLFTVTFDSNKDDIVTKQEFQIAWFKIHDHSGHNPTGMSVIG